MDVVIYGIGKLAEYVLYALTNDTEYNVKAFCVKKEYKGNKEKIGDLPVVDFEDIEDMFPTDKYQLFVAVGLNKERCAIFDTLKLKGYKMISYVSSKAIVWDDLIYGENVWVSEGTSIQPLVSIGDDVIFFGGNIGHHSKIGNHALLSSATLGGAVEIGDFSMLGMNSAVKQNVKIGTANIIGMGSVIEKDTKENEIYHSGKSTIKRNITTDKIEKRYLK